MSGGEKSSFFGKFGVLYFLETPVLIFALLPYYRRLIKKLVYLVLIVIIIFFVKSLNHYELLLVNQAWRPATLLKKWLQHRCFPVNILKFLRTAFLWNTSVACIICGHRIYQKVFFNRLCQYLPFLNIFFNSSC